MKILYSLLFLSLLLLTGCFHSGRPATLASTEGFTRALTNRLEQLGPLHYSVSSSGQSGNVHTREGICQISAESCPPEKIVEVGKAALADWGELETFSSRGFSYGGTHFGLHYNSSDTYAFIDLIAFPDREQSNTTRIEIYINVIE